MTSLGGLCLPVESKAPSADEGLLQYIDLSAIDARSKTISEPKHIDANDAPSRARQRVSATDVLVSTVRPNLNGVAQVPAELDGAVASTGFTVLRANPELLDHRYLFHWVRGEQFIFEIVRQATGASYPAVSDRIIKASRIPLPPLPEQRRIASILDQADSICSRFRRASDLWAALGSSYYSKILISDGDRGSTWPRIPIGDLGQVVTGQTPPGGETTAESDDVPFITPGDLGDTDAAPKRYLSAANVARSRIVKPGSLLVCCIGTIGKSRTFERPVAFNQQINAIEWGPDVLPDFGEFAVASITAEMQARASSTTLPILRKSTFEQFVIPVPPLAVQQEFSEVVSKTRAIRGLTAEAGKTAAALQRSLADRFFRG